MKTIFSQTEEARSFKCPGCRQFISSNFENCRFCKIPLSPETKRSAIENEKKEIRRYRFNNHLKHFLIGIVVLPAAITVNLLMLWGLAEGAPYAIIFYGAVFYGVSELGYGIYGFIQDFFDKAKNV